MHPISRIFLFILLGCQTVPDKQVIHLTELDDLSLSDHKQELSTPYYRTPLDTNWRDVVELDSSIVIDMRYASLENFVGLQLYPCGRCILRTEVAESIARIQIDLKTKGLGLKMYDCYRPASVQSTLWSKMPDARYVTPPERGSMHSKGAAVDVTIVDRDGNELDMGTPFDFFGEASHHTSAGHSDSVMTHRSLLKSSMERVGFRPIRTEWWHYSYQSRTYEISDYQWPCP
jgi:D-alanyl-D-alanine dipeptidase